MLIKAILSTTVKSDLDFRRVIKQRQILCFIIMILGIATAAFSFYFSTGQYALLSDFFSGFYFGVGTGLLVAGILAYINCRSLLKNEKKLHEKRLAETDERNKAISQKTLFMTSVVLIIILYIALIVSGLFSMMLFQTLLCIIGLYLLIFLISYAYYNKKL